jgi:hypothetical protein
LVHFNKLASLFELFQDESSQVEHLVLNEDDHQLKSLINFEDTDWRLAKMRQFIKQQQWTIYKLSNDDQSLVKAKLGPV